MNRVGPRRMWALSIAGAVTASALAISHRNVTRFSSMHIPWWALAVLFALAEIHVVHIQFRRETETFSLNEIPLVLGLFFASPTELIVGQLLGAGVALIVHRRQPALKWTYNLAQLCLGATVASIVFHAIAHPSRILGGSEIAGTFAAAVAAIVLGVLAVVAAITLTEGELRTSMVRRVLAFGLLGTTASTALALTGVSVIRADVRSAWLLLIPVTALVAAYSGYSSYRRQHETLSQLYEATHDLHRTLDMKPVLRSLLEVVREMLRADIATVTLFPQEPGEPSFEASLSGDDDIDSLSAVTLDPTEGVWARVAAEGQGILLARPIGNERLRVHFASKGLKDVMVAPLFGEKGVIGTILVGNRLGDVETFRQSDLKLLETLVTHASASLENARLVTRLQDSLADMKELNRLKDEFLAAVSHDLRTPVAAIMASAGAMLTNGIDEKERTEFTQLIERQGKRLRDLIDDLLITARLESGNIQPNISRVSIADVCNSVVQSFAAQETGHTFALEIGEIPTVATDEASLHRILQNLVSNAVKYSRPGSTIRLNASSSPDEVVLSVTNEGTPIPASQHEAIFERFVRLHRNGDGGTGLGLYVCRRLAESLGGRVWLERSNERGSTFTLAIPPRVPTRVDAGIPVFH